MKQLIIESGNYCIYQVCSRYLHGTAKFVVEENYKHHHNTEIVYANELENEIKSVYQEELAYQENSNYFIVENLQSQMIGCIRVMKWNMQQKLPMQKIFGINPLEHIEISDITTFWHIGRFAISACSDIPSVTLFKQLMIYSIYPICQEKDGYMLAECDSKLLQTMSLLGIKTVSLGKSLYYLGSETVPVYADKNGLKMFYQNFGYLHHAYSIPKDSIEAA